MKHQHQFAFVTELYSDPNTGNSRSWCDMAGIIIFDVIALQILQAKFQLCQEISKGGSHSGGRGNRGKSKSGLASASKLAREEVSRNGGKVSNSGGRKSSGGGRSSGR